MKRDYQNQGRPLPPTLSRIILTAEEENRQVLRVADFTKFYQTNDNNARAMIAQLVDKGWLIRLGRGCYQLQSAKTGLEPYPTGDKFVTAGQFAPDSFIAYGSAAEYHGLTTQVFQKVLLATARRRKEMSLPKLRIRFILIEPDNFVGFQKTTKAPDVKVATIERTIIDAIDRPDLCGGISDLKEILKRARGKVSTQRILEYLPTYHSKSLIQRVGYLLESEGFDLKPAEKKRLLSWCQGNKTYLFSRKQAGATKLHDYSKYWQLVINAPGFAPQTHRGEDS